MSEFVPKGEESPITKNLAVVLVVQSIIQRAKRAAVWGAGRVKIPQLSDLTTPRGCH